MDNSIADILASVTRSHETAAQANGLHISPPEAQQQADLQHLTQAWISERMAPELLPYPTELIDRIMTRIREQIETIEERTARMDAGTSFILVIMQTELERFKFLVRSFLRTRIAKIDAHPYHLLSHLTTYPPLLSTSETQYLQTHAALLERHYNSSFLSSFPAKLRRLDDRAGAGGVGMVEGPDLERAVFVRCLGVPREHNAGRKETDFGTGLDDNEDDKEEARREAHNGHWGTVNISGGFVGEVDEDGDRGLAGLPEGGRDRRRESGERVVKMKRGEIWIVRWSGVRDAVARGECELV